MAGLPVRFALYCEGASDRHFLPVLIRRAVEQIVTGRSRYELDIFQVTVVNEWNGQPDPVGTYKNRVLEAARRASGYDALVLHRDADSPNARTALRRYIQPACKHTADSKESVCKTLIPMIPVRCIEAWMLVDAEAIHAVTETNMRPEQLGLPATPQQAESIQKPKDVLRQVVETARGSRRRGRREMDIADLYVNLAQEINLSLLEQTASYSQFCTEIEQALIALRKIMP